MFKKKTEEKKARTHRDTVGHTFLDYVVNEDKGVWTSVIRGQQTQMK